jgi:hypothetical protein
MSKTLSSYSNTVNGADFVLLNRDNSTGGGGTITSTPTKVAYASAYTSTNSTHFTTNLFVPVANVSFDITPASSINEVHFTTTLLGASNRDVIFYLGDSLGAEVTEPRRYVKTSTNQTITYYDCKYFSPGEYFMYMYYDNATGSGTDITIDHPIFTIKKII